jgi:hypothetical protein
MTVSFAYFGPLLMLLDALNLFVVGLRYPFQCRIASYFNVGGDGIRSINLKIVSTITFSIYPILKAFEVPMDACTRYRSCHRQCYECEENVFTQFLVAHILQMLNWL